jgi:hypothetical protein
MQLSQDHGTTKLHEPVSILSHIEKVTRYPLSWLANRKRTMFLATAQLGKMEAGCRTFSPAASRLAVRCGVSRVFSAPSPQEGGSTFCFRVRGPPRGGGGARVTASAEYVQQLSFFDGLRFGSASESSRSKNREHSREKDTGTAHPAVLSSSRAGAGGRHRPEVGQGGSWQLSTSAKWRVRSI